LGILDLRPELLRHMVAKGFTVLGYGTDVAVLRSAYASGLAALRALDQTGRQP